MLRIIFKTKIIGFVIIFVSFLFANFCWLQETAINSAPTAVLTYEKQASVLVPVYFDGSQSYDPDGDYISFQWDFGDGVVGTGKTINHSYKEPDVYTVVLTVIDEKNHSDTAECKVIITNSIPELEGPSNLTGKLLSDRIILSWQDNSDNESGFAIQRKKSEQQNEEYVYIVNDLEENSIYYEDSNNLNDKDSYSYRVRAFTDQVVSAFSNEIQIQYIEQATTPMRIIIDHTSIENFQKLTISQIEDAKKVLVLIPGESHSRAYGYGLELLEFENSVLDVSTDYRGAPEAYRDDAMRWSLTSRRESDGYWRYSTGEAQFFTNSSGRSDIASYIQYLDTNYTGTIIFGFGWCWDMTWHNSPTATKDSVYGCGWAGSSVGGPDGDEPWGIDDDDNTITDNSVNLQTYLDAVDAYNALGTRVIVIYTTGPVDSYRNSESGYQRWLKHEAIRNYVDKNGGVLFDFADLLSYDYENNQRFIESWNDKEWYGINPAFDDESYDCRDVGCHITDNACKIIGRALWVLASELYKETN